MVGVAHALLVHGSLHAHGLQIGLEHFGDAQIEGLTGLVVLGSNEDIQLAAVGHIPPAVAVSIHITALIQQGVGFVHVLSQLGQRAVKALIGGRHDTGVGDLAVLPSDGDAEQLVVQRGPHGLAEG